ncbi:MAG TPA: iron ABC transporter permease [Mycobacterium sp.]|nr:iron ABC transporter permease [Mycobacterium sp.]
MRIRYPAAALVATVSLGLLAVGIGWSVAIGPTHLGVGAIVTGVLFGGHTTGAAIIHGIRLPRALLGAVVGSSSAVAGAIMQAVTANPLGSPEILGVNAGAAVVAVASLTFVPWLAGLSLIALAFVGAAAAGLLVLIMSGIGRGRSDPVRIALAGVTLTTLIFSVAQGMIILHDPATSALFHWLVGGVNDGTWHDIGTALPWMIVGLGGAMALAGKLNLLGLGEDTARGLGAKIGQIRLIGAALVVVLAGSAVAVAGPITFVGLIVPHIVRRLVGVNHYVVIPLCALVGATMLVYADIVSRYIDPPAEVPSGVVTALVGAPYFVYLARRQKATS